MKIEEIMTRNVSVCCIDDTLNTAAQRMWENDCGCVPVVGSDGDGTVVGIVTDRDICMAAYTQGKRLFEIPVTTAMARKVICCSPGDDVMAVEAMMRKHQVRRIPVIEKSGRLVGIVAINDLAREAGRELSAGARPEVTEIEVAQTLESLCRPREKGALMVPAA